MPSFKYQKDSLLEKGPNWQLNACVGKNGGDYDFIDYAKGYFIAASHMLAAVSNGEAYKDLTIYPTVYLFRHAFELSLKALCRKLNILNEIDGDFTKTHKLLRLWSEIEKQLNAHPDLFEAETISRMRDMISDLDALDATAEVFRFPEDKSGKLHLQDRSLINYGRMQVLLTARPIFEQWYFETESIIDLRNESDVQ